MFLDLEDKKVLSPRAGGGTNGVCINVQGSVNTEKVLPMTYSGPFSAASTRELGRVD